MSDLDLKGLFQKHAKALHSFLLRKSRDPQLAADLTQESFLRLAEQRAHVADHARLVVVFDDEELALGLDLDEGQRVAGRALELEGARLALTPRGLSAIAARS